MIAAPVLPAPTVTPERARAIRDALGYTQDQLAAVFDLSPEHGKRQVRRWETAGPPVAVGMALLWLEAQARKRR